MGEFVTITATSRYIYVSRADGSLVSKHLTVEDAIEAAVNAGLGEYRIQYPDRKVVVSKVYGTLPSSPAPAAPTALTLEDFTAGYVVLSWTDDGSGTSWTVYRNGAPIGTPTGTSYTDSTVVPSTLYSYQVQASNSTGSSALSDALPVTTSANSLPEWGLTDQSGTIDAAFSLDLNTVCGDVDGHARTYTLVSGSVPGLSLASPNYSGTPTTAGAYPLTFRASDGYGTSDVSITLNVYDPDVTAPTVPANVSASANGSTVTVSWTASTDATGVAAYRVYRGGVFRSLSTASPYVESGVPNGSYSYTVSAVDSSANANESAQSSAAIAVISAGIVDTPLNFTASAASDTQINLSWLPGPSGPSPDDYDVDFSTTSASGPWTALPVGGPVKHYIAYELNRNGVNSTFSTATEPGVTGVQLRYAWKDIEPTLGNYDFSQITSDLANAAAVGLKVIVLIIDKTFDATVATPAYLDAYTKPHRLGAADGTILMRWLDYPRDRMVALMQQLGAQFNTTPALEAVATQETSIGISDADQTANGYTHQLYRDSYKTVLTAACIAFSQKRVFWYMNFIASTPGLNGGQAMIGDVIDYMIATGRTNFSFGGPDILPENYSLNTNTYPYYDTYDGVVPMFCSNQFNSYEEVKSAGPPIVYYTMQEMLDWATANLHIGTCLWNYLTTASPADSNDIQDAYAVIAGDVTPSFRHTGRTASVRHWYRIKAKRSGATSSGYATANATTQAVSALPFPAQPGGPPWLHGPGQVGTYSLTDATSGLYKWQQFVGHNADIVVAWSALSSNTTSTWAEIEGTTSGTFGGTGANFKSAVQNLPPTRPIVHCCAAMPGNLGDQLSNYHLQNPAAWDAIAAGRYNDHYTAMGDNMKAFMATYGRLPSSLVIRLGWEMTGDWYPWSMPNNIVGFKAGWKVIVDILRARMPGVKIDLSIHRRRPGYTSVGGSNYTVTAADGRKGYDLSQWIPIADSYDFFACSQHDWSKVISGYNGGVAVSTVDEYTWNYLHLNPPVSQSETGLQEACDWARARGKGFGISEWGIQYVSAGSLPASVHPSFFLTKIFNFLYANRDIAWWDGYLVNSETNMANRTGAAFNYTYGGQTFNAATTYKTLWV